MNALFQELGCLWRLARRWFYLTFRRGYVRRMAARRKGVCGRHGCCNLSALAKLRRCFDPEDDAYCLKKDNLPLFCRMYPFDEKDKHPATRAYCNFYWDDENRADNPPGDAGPP